MKELVDRLEKRVSEHLSKCFYPDRMSIDTADVQEALELLKVNRPTRRNR